MFQKSVRWSIVVPPKVEVEAAKATKFFSPVFSIPFEAHGRRMNASWFLLLTIGNDLGKMPSGNYQTIIKMHNLFNYIDNIF